MQYLSARLGLTISFFVLAASGAHALDGPDDGGGFQSTAADQPDRRRLLWLDDGSVLRARSRCEQGAWQVRAGRNWEVLGAAVVGQRLEREALAEAKRRLADVGRDDHDARVRVAAWMLDTGLDAEALTALNLVLSGQRDHVGALDLLATGRIELDLGKAGPELTSARLAALLDAGARAGLAESEVAVRGLEEFAQLTDLRRVLEVELTHPSHRRRSFATLSARRLFGGEFTSMLVERALWDRYETVRRSAGRALAGASEAQPITLLTEALSHEHSVVRLHAIEAMSNMGYAAAVEPLVVHLTMLQASSGAAVGTRANLYVGGQRAIVRDFDVEIAQGQSIADPIVGVVESGVILDVRSVAQITRVAEQRAVTAALRELTGESLPAKPGPWIEWWAAKQKHVGALNTEERSRNIPSKDE